MARRDQMPRLALTLAALALCISRAIADVDLVGEKQQWHKLTLVFDGPAGLSEDNAATFSDYRLDVTFTSGSETYVVPGYYAADGNAAQTGATSGNKWHCHFTPSMTGSWSWSASFTTGSDAAIGGGGSAKAPIDGLSGSFSVSATDKSGNDNRRRGMLKYVGKHHLRWAGTGEYFIKTGSDSPENLLAYADFDGTPDYKGFRKNYMPHVSDWQDGDPTWKGGMGKGLIGAINYMSGMGMNVMSFLTMNIEGDDRNVFPYVSQNKFTTFDVSKLAQWEIVMEHMDRKGIYMHFKLTETENDEMLGYREVQLYYREIVARFGHHLALNWNIGEENDNSHQDLTRYGNFIRSLDPYDHHVVVHTRVYRQAAVFEPILDDIADGVQTAFTGASLQTKEEDSVHQQTLQWLQMSDAAGRPWVVASDETGPAKDGILPDDASRDNHLSERTFSIYGNLMAGGGGCESYFGYNHDNSDVTLQDFRSRNNWWKQAYHARSFFEMYLPFWEMSSMDNIVSGGAWAFGKTGSVYAIYLPRSNNVEVSLDGESTNFQISWYDPAEGGALQSGSVDCASGGKTSSLGNPPGSSGDWLALLTSGCDGSAPPTVPDLPEVPETEAPVDPPTNPSSGGSCFGEEDGRIVIQTESTRLTGDWKEGTSYSYTGDGYICHQGGNAYNFEENGILSYNIVAAGGDYMVYGIVLRPSNDFMRSDEGNDFYVFDGRVPTKLYASMGLNFDEWSLTSKFDHNHQKREPIITLPEGQSTFKIAARSEGLCIDYIELVMVGQDRLGTGETTMTPCDGSQIGGPPSVPDEPIESTPVPVQTSAPESEPTSDATEVEEPGTTEPSSESCFGESEGNILIEADRTTLSSGWERSRDLSGYTGDGFIAYMDTEQEPYDGKGVLKYKIYSEMGGTYYLYPRTARLSKYHTTGDNRDNNDLWVFGVDSRPVKTVSVFEYVDDKWVTESLFYRGADTSTPVLSVSAGYSEFTVAARSFGFAVDSFRLVRKGSEMSSSDTTVSCP